MQENKNVGLNGINEQQVTEENILSDDEILEQEVEDGISQEDEDPELEAKIQKAKSLGWKSKDEFNGSPEHYKDLDTFLQKTERKAIIKQNALSKFATKQDIDDVRKKLEEHYNFVQEQHKKQEEVKYTDYISTLEKQMQDAVDEGDAERLKKLQLDWYNSKVILEQAKQPKKEEVQQQRIPIEIQEWNLANQHIFNQDGADYTFTKFANAKFDEINKSEPHLTLTGKLARVQRYLNEFYYETHNAKPSHAPAVINAKPTSNVGMRTANNLNEENKSMLNAVVQNARGSGKSDAQIQKIQNDFLQSCTAEDFIKKPIK